MQLLTLDAMRGPLKDATPLKLWENCKRNAAVSPGRITVTYELAETSSCIYRQAETLMDCGKLTVARPQAVTAVQTTKPAKIAFGLLVPMLKCATGQNRIAPREYTG